MAANPNRHPHEISGHPVVELYLAADQEPVLLTCCANCGNLRTIVFLTGDRWLCFTCKTEGSTKPRLYPLA